MISFPYFFQAAKKKRFFLYDVGGPSNSYNMTESLPSDEKLLLNIIEEAGSTGIWYELF